jgi:hypothetical protein
MVSGSASGLKRRRPPVVSGIKPSLIGRQSSVLLDPFFELHHQCNQRKRL